MSITDDVDMRYDATMNGVNCIAIVDSGASHAFISTDNACELRLPFTRTPPVVVELADGSTITSTATVTCRLNVGGIIVEETAFVVPLNTTQVLPTIIIGRSWLRRLNPAVD